MYTQTLPWKNSKLKLNNNLHTLCSYMAMFPPALPNHFIRKYSSEGDTVFDPFSGRGTTVLESCKLKRYGIGNDLNPLAFILTKAKSNVPQKGRIISRINSLKEECVSTNVRIGNINDNIRMIFSEFTLLQLVFLKEQLNWKKSNVDTFITAALLGIMHGKSNGYLSLSMPNTFSMAPNYIKNYIIKHKLQKPQRDVFELLLRKINRVYERPSIKGKVYSQDARNLSRIKNSSVDLIVTSPPYTRVITYGQYNWIRLWFIDKNEKSVDRKLFFSESINKYTSFMFDVFSEFKRILKPNGTAVVVIGDVRHRNKNFKYNLAQTVWEQCAAPQGFTLNEEIQEDLISLDSKVSKIWGKTKGKATEIDRILVLRNN